MKKLLYPFAFALTAFLILYSCSAEEEDTTPPPQVQQPTPEPEPEVSQFTLTVAAGEGGTVSTEGGTYDEGTEVTITATPSEGYRFVSWEGNTSTSDSLTITLNSNQTYTALFELIPPIYNLNIFSSEGGTTSLEGGEFEDGSVIEISALPSEGYIFNSWSTGETKADYQFTITSNVTLTASFTALDFNSSTMDEIKYGYYSKDTLTGKSTVNLKEFFFPYLQWEFSQGVENDLDYLSSENFIVYWDKRYDHKEYAIDILRWSEFSAEKAINVGCKKPKDYDTHRINIFIFRNDEFGEDVFGPDFGQAAHGDSNGRSFITYPYYNNFNTIQREYPTMDVLHETYHIFQGSDNPLFDSRRWYTESTAEYFQSRYVADVRPATLRFIAHFLQSTHIRIWKSYGSTPNELQHLYGLQILLHYLEWEGIIDENFIGKSWNDSNQNETPLEYLIRKIPSFEDVYFDFCLKSTTIDFLNWKSLIYDSLYQLDNGNYWEPGKRHELTLENQGSNGLYTPENLVEGWGFSSVKIMNYNNSTYTLNFNSDVETFRIGLIKELNGQFEYEEIEKQHTFSLTANQNAYVVFVNLNQEFYGDNTFPFQFEIIKN